MIKKQDVNIYKILVIRDYIKSELFQSKLSSLATNKNNVKIISLLEKAQLMIDCCLSIKNLKGKEK